MPEFIFSHETIEYENWSHADVLSKRHSKLAPVLVVSTDSVLKEEEPGLTTFERIVVICPDFNDGRIFSLGRRLRQLGFAGNLSAVGDLLQDQYTSLHYCGFDEVLSLDPDTEFGVIELDRFRSLAELQPPTPGDTDRLFAVEVSS